MALFVYQLTEAVDTVEGLYLLKCLRVEVTYMCTECWVYS
jgi:hypothetical protein